MTLPRYLQVALLLSVLAAIGSLLFLEEAPEIHLPEQTAATTPLTLYPQNNRQTPRQDLFSVPVKVLPTPVKTPDKPSVRPATPPFPLQVMGAWWSQNQRIILLTNGHNTWPVCKGCKAEEKIWIGDQPVAGWVLKAVATDHLLFEWQLTHAQQRLELGDLHSEPTL